MKSKTKVILAGMAVLAIFTALIIVTRSSLGLNPTLVMVGSIFVVMAVTVAVVNHWDREGSKFDAKEIWRKSKDVVITLSVVIIGLVLANWLCAEIGWSWWRVNHDNKALFWVTQFAIVFFFIAPMILESQRTRLVARVVLLIVVCGWVYESKDVYGWFGKSQSVVKAGQWSDPVAIDMHLNCRMEPDVGYTVRPNGLEDDGMDLRHEVGDPPPRFPSRLIVSSVRFKPDKDMKVIVISKD